MKNRRVTEQNKGYNESQIERALGLAVEKVGGLCWKWPATSRAGVPDRIVVYNGRVVFVEVKADAGRLTPIQILQHQHLSAAGAEVRTVKGMNEAMALVRELTEE